MVQSWLRTWAWSGNMSSANMDSSPDIGPGYWCSIIEPRSMSKDATSIYSTWFSGLSAGYCERSGGAERVGGWGRDLEASDECAERECEEGELCSKPSAVARLEVV
jgi:hypothetical protein